MLFADVRTALADEPNWGTLKGTILLDGEIPQLKPLIEKDSPAKDAAVCAAQDIPDEQIVVDTKTRGLANVVVYLPKSPMQVHPDLATVGKPGEANEKNATKVPAEVRFKVKGCQYEPHVLIVRTGQQLRFDTRDSVAHNLHVHTVKNIRFGDIVKPNGINEVYGPYNSPERLPVSVRCDIHPWMSAYWVIMDHPYAAVTDRQGAYEIPNLPVGEHDFIIWHEKQGFINKNFRVIIKAGMNEQKAVSARIGLPDNASETHARQRKQQ